MWANEGERGKEKEKGEGEVEIWMSECLGYGTKN